MFTPIPLSCRAWALSLMLAVGLSPAWAASPQRATEVEPAQVIEALTRANAAVVGLKVAALEGARSAQTLGPQREGSGVVIGPDGLIVTIGYLLLEARSVEIVTQDNRTVPAVVAGYDLASGFGLVRPLVPLKGIQPVTLGAQGSLAVGETLMAATGGEDGEVAMTRLVSKRAFSGYWEYHIDSALFTAPPIDNHSGAPLFNQRGELMGIGSLFVADALGRNLRAPGNMFVPVDLLRPILDELRTTGSTRMSRRPWLGLSSTEQGGRVQVMRVAPDGPAQAAGLKTGDMILAVDGARVATLQEFYKALWSHAQPDDEIVLTVLQGPEVREIRLKAVDRMSTLMKADGV